VQTLSQLDSSSARLPSRLLVLPRDATARDADLAVLPQVTRWQGSTDLCT
jgi:hypothetical protein